MDDAVNRGALGEVQELLNQGVDPNLRDVAGDPILVSAAWVGAADIVKLLLERGADVNATGANGRNALQRALSNKTYWDDGHSRAVALLRAAGGTE